MWAAAIPAIAAVAGSLIGARSQRNANEANEQVQREFAQHGVSWRVADAKAAGLHPLFALSGSGATYSPSAQPVFNGAELGQNLSRAASAFSSPTDQELKKAQLEAVQAATTRDYAQASVFASEAKRLEQQSNPPVAQSFPVSMPGQTLIKNSDAVAFDGLASPAPLAPMEPVPPYLSTQKAEPGFKVFAVPGVGEVILPQASSMSEALESLENPVLQAAVAAANAVHYGPAGSRRLERLTGFGPRKMPRAWSDPWGALGEKLDSYRR